MLEFIDVTKTYGGVKALEAISFKLENGEFVFVTGPSGAGKTTLLRLILRETLPDSGKILIDGEEITKLKSRKIPGLRQQIGVVFQDFKLLTERTIWENIEIALAVIGLSKNEWKARVAHVLTLVGLSERARFFPLQLSGGELQRASLARALVVNPKIILADEPTGNLDWETADSLMDLFEAINKEGKTIIMATHNKLIIDKMGKRVIKLNGGRLIDHKINHKKESKVKETEKEKENKVKVQI